MVAESEAIKARGEHYNLKENLVQSLFVIEKMKNQPSHCKTSEAKAKELVGNTLMQLETAKKMVETLWSDGYKSTEAYDAVAFELEKSRARVKFLEELVSKLNADITNAKLEVEQLRSALEVAEIRHNEERAQSIEEMRNAFVTVEQMKSASGQREAELEAELRKSSYEIEELKSNLMAKETELQGVCEENDTLIIHLQNTLSGHKEHELEKEVEKLKTDVENTKARLKDKETEFQNVLNENKALKMEIKETRGAEREAVMKAGCMAEEVDKSNKKTMRVSEQLEAAQAANAEMEGELRRLKVQLDQWRKAAETAASMVSNGQVMERMGSIDCPRIRRVASPYEDESDEDVMEKKNVNLLSRFAVPWKKPQK